MTTKKAADGKVTAEGASLRGKKFPRKSGLTNQTKGKRVGKRAIAPKRSVVNFARRSR
jgi:hypothetical protein